MWPAGNVFVESFGYVRGWAVSVSYPANRHVHMCFTWCGIHICTKLFRRQSKMRPLVYIYASYYIHTKFRLSHIVARGNEEFHIQLCSFVDGFILLISLIVYCLCYEPFSILIVIHAIGSGGLAYAVVFSFYSHIIMLLLLFQWLFATNIGCCVKTKITYIWKWMYCIEVGFFVKNKCSAQYVLSDAVVVIVVVLLRATWSICFSPSQFVHRRVKIIPCVVVEHVILVYDGELAQGDGGQPCLTHCSQCTAIFGGWRYIIPNSNIYSLHIGINYKLWKIALCVCV